MLSYHATRRRLACLTTVVQKVPHLCNHMQGTQRGTLLYSGSRFTGHPERADTTGQARATSVHVHFQYVHPSCCCPSHFEGQRGLVDLLHHRMQLPSYRPQAMAARNKRTLFTALTRSAYLRVGCRLPNLDRRDPVSPQLRVGSRDQRGKYKGMRTKFSSFITGRLEQ